MVQFTNKLLASSLTGMGAECRKLLNCENTGKNIAGSRVRRTLLFFASFAIFAVKSF
jgi:hypothetical protein